MSACIIRYFDISVIKLKIYRENVALYSVLEQPYPGINKLTPYKYQSENTVLVRPT